MPTPGCGKGILRLLDPHSPCTLCLISAQPAASSRLFSVPVYAWSAPAEAGPRNRERTVPSFEVASIGCNEYDHTGHRTLSSLRGATSTCAPWI